MDDQLSLPGMDAAPPPTPPGEGVRAIDLTQAPRLRRVDRAQVRLVPCALEESLPCEHDARLVWDLVTQLDLSPFEGKVAARGSVPGRPATDPRILIALWLYAGIKGVGCGREIDRRVHCDDGFRWIAGGVSLDYHILNDFRVGHEGELDGIFTATVAALVKQGLVDVTRLAQDGLRVRASAGSNSFRREKTLKELHADAQEHLVALKKQSDGEFLSRQQAKELSDAKDREARIAKALALLPDLRAAHEEASKRKGKEPGEVRVSMTDPEARMMRMPDGGSRPAYNVQLSADVKGRAIVGVDVTSEGVDYGQATPMRQQVEERSGQTVNEQLVDGGFASLKEIDEGERAGVAMYAPVPNKCKNRNPDADPYARKRDDTDATFRWRQRMATDEAKTIYKQRGATIETINGDLTEHRGLRRLRVRGPTKVRCVLLWLALAYNILRFRKDLITVMCEKS